MSFKAIIFDLDGTLLDTLEDLADSANQVLVANSNSRIALKRRNSVMY